MYEGAYVRSDAQRRCCTAQSAAADFVRPSHRRRLRRGAASAARAPSRSSSPLAHRPPARPPSRLSSSPSPASSLCPSAPSLAPSLAPASRCTHTQSHSQMHTHARTHARCTRVTGLARRLVRLRCCLWSATPSTGVRGCTRQCVRSSRVAEARSSCPGTRCAHPAATRARVRERMSARARVPADACCVRLHACTSAANGATGARIART